MTEVQNEVRALRERYECGDATAVDGIKEQLAKYHFYHNIEVVPGVVTAGLEWADDFVNRVITTMRLFNFRGKRVLDIGCRDGAESFAAEELGASEVVGIDNDLSDGLTNFLIPFKGSKLRAIQWNVLDLSPDQFGEFDIVLFPGVLYHLRYPIWGLRRIAEVLKPNGVLIIEGGFIDGFADLPVMFCPIGTDSPYEPTSTTFFNEAGIKDTLLSIGFSEIRLHDSYNYVSKERDQKYLAEKFPKFFRAGSGNHKLSVCRKIFSCLKKWSADDKRVGPGALPMKWSQQEVLQRYWDGTHEIHTKWSFGPND